MVRPEAQLDHRHVTIGEIIRNLGIEDEKYDRSETSGIGHIIEGICLTQASDQERLARGSFLFDDSYERFRRTASEGRTS